MKNYHQCIGVRDARVSRDCVLELLSDAGLFPSPHPSRLAAVCLEAGVGVKDVSAWIEGEMSATWQELSLLALALNLHPTHVRRSQTGRAVGPWFITPTAITQYRELFSNTIDHDAARDELAEMAAETLSSARIPRTEVTGLKIYRGPRPMRLELIVAPGDEYGELPALIKVHHTHAGIHATIAEGSLNGLNEKDFRSWLGAWLSRRFGGAEVSTSIGERALSFGVSAALIQDARSEFIAEKKNELGDAAFMLHQAIYSWSPSNGTERETYANDARVAAIAIAQFLKTHRQFVKVSLSERAALEHLIGAETNERHSILSRRQRDLLNCAKRLESEAKGSSQ